MAYCKITECLNKTRNGLYYNYIEQPEQSGFLSQSKFSEKKVWSTVFSFDMFIFSDEFTFTQI